MRWLSQLAWNGGEVCLRGSQRSVKKFALGKTEIPPLLGTVSRKKVAVLLDFIQMSGGGGPAQFCPHLRNRIYWVNLGMGRRGRPLPKFFGTLGFKKVVQVVQIRGGGRGNLDKIQKNSYFFSGDRPLASSKKIGAVLKILCLLLVFRPPAPFRRTSDDSQSTWREFGRREQQWLGEGGKVLGENLHQEGPSWKLA